MGIEDLADDPNFLEGLQILLTEPVRLENGKLAGDIDSLHANVVYALGDTHLLHIIPDADHQPVNYRLYERNGKDGLPFRSGVRVTCAHEGELEYRLAGLIKNHGPLTNAQEADIGKVEKYLELLNEWYEHPQVMIEGEQHTRLVDPDYMPGSAAYDLEHLKHGKKKTLPENFGKRLQQAAEDKLGCAYKSHLSATASPVEPAISSPTLDTPALPPVEPVTPPLPPTEKIETRAAEVLEKAGEAEQKSAAHMSGKTKWVLSGIGAATVAVGAYLMIKKKPHAPQEQERLENAKSPSGVTPSL